MISNDTKLLASLSAAGALVGIGKLLATGDKITVRAVVARAVTSGALGLAAAAAPILIPTVSFEAQVGIACILASLGTSALEAAFQKFLSK